MTSGRPEQPFEVVLICTGNRARSPIAEGFLRHLVGDLPVQVHSVGTLELQGAPALPEALDAASQAGLDISAHRARALRDEDISQADLVLGFELSHVAAAVVDGGASPGNVFLLPELVRLIEGSEAPRHVADPIERARDVISRAHAIRSGVSNEEIADPLGQSAKFYRDTVERVRDLSTRLAIGLFGRERLRPLSP